MSRSPSFPKTLGAAPLRESVIPGKFIRFSTNDDNDDKAGWLKLFEDGQGGVFGDFRQGISESWRVLEPQTPEEQDNLRLRIGRAKAEAAAQEATECAKAKAAIEELWEHAASADPQHPYLVSKSVKSHGIRRQGDSLLIPVKDIEGNLHGLQTIGPDGGKQFRHGSRVTGNFHLLGEVGGRVLIVEGYATGATLREVTGDAVAIAFNLGNLKPVAEALRSKYPDTLIMICADDDYQTQGNPGLKAALEAVKAVNGVLAVPSFPDTRDAKDTDFNDMARLSGQDAVRACIEAASMPAPSSAMEDTPKDEPLGAAVRRLAALSPLEYSRVRKTEAKALGVQLRPLDGAVKAARKEKGRDNLRFTDNEPWPEPIDPAQLFTDIAKTVRRFIVCTEEIAHAVALWVAMTWVIHVIQVAPIILITAPEMRCGKSLLLHLIGKLCPRALTSSHITPAALFRTIEAWQPTLLIDEVDAFMKDNEEMRGLLNSGHTRDSAFVIRTVGDDHTPTQFSTWGAKALSGIGHLNAATLMDRSIVLELRRKLQDEKIERIRHTDPGLFDQLRSKLARFAEDYSEMIRLARPPLPESLNDRAQDNWETLLAIAMTAGDEWLQKGTTAALKLSGVESASRTIGNELLHDIQEVFKTNQVDRMSTKDLIGGLCADAEKPWSSYNKGKAITDRQVAKLLKGYGIQSKGIRIGNETPKGYERDQFADAFCRYLPSGNIRHTQQSAPVQDLRANGIRNISATNLPTSTIII